MVQQVERSNVRKDIRSWFRKRKSIKGKMPVCMYIYIKSQKKIRSKMLAFSNTDFSEKGSEKCKR